MLVLAFIISPSFASLPNVTENTQLIEHLMCSRHFPHSSGSQIFWCQDTFVLFIKEPQQALGYVGYSYDVHPTGDSNKEII